MMWIFGSMALGLTLSLSATIASFGDWDSRFRSRLYCDFKNVYRVPEWMMFAVGLGIVPIVGVFFGVASWIAFFARGHLTK